MKSITFATLLCLFVAGCGRNSLSGTYLPKGGGMGNGLVISKLEIVSGTEVNISMMDWTVRAIQGRR
jgi:hypothetical protein